MEFEPFPKIPRLNRETVITEKIDGTNAAIVITERPDDAGYAVLTQSRKRFITPGKGTDNYGFAAWAQDHADRLVEILGPGRHFGEWWGKGIARGYGLDHKRFSLFNTTRWIPSQPPGGRDDDWALDAELGLYVVPTLAIYDRFPPQGGDWELRRLQLGGSHAAPGFDRPEGIILYHSVSNSMFKATIDNDELPKDEVERQRRLAGEKVAVGGLVREAELYLSEHGCELPGMWEMADLVGGSTDVQISTVPGMTSLVLDV